LSFVIDAAAILNWEAEGDIFLFPFSFLPRRFPAATREASPKNEAGKGKNEEFQLSLRIAVDAARAQAMTDDKCPVKNEQ
jgi:hypothetical protein